MAWTGETGGRVVGSPASVSETVFVGSEDGSVYAFAADGRGERWTFETDDAVLASVAVGAGLVYAGSRDGRLYALDARHGTERWVRGLSGPVVYSSPAVVDGELFVGTIDGALHGLIDS